MLKNCALILALAGVIYLVPSIAAAQDNGGNAQQAPPSEQERGHGRFDPARRTEMLTRQLNLNSDQQSKVLDILKSAQSQMQSIRSDSSLSPQQRRAKMMDVRKATNDQVREVLTPDQQKKFDEMTSRREHRQEPQNNSSNPQ